MKHQRVTLNKVGYHITSTGTGIPLLLLHGFTGSSANWHPHMDRFGEHYHTTAVDLIGHGQTDAPLESTRYRMERSAADLAALIIEHLNPPIHLLGYSMGGRLALYLALAYPELCRTLILESASPGLPDPAARDTRRAQDDALADRIVNDGIPAFIDFWEAIPLFHTQRRLPAERQDRLRNQRLANRPEGLANSLRGMGTGVQPSLWDRLTELIHPTLLLTGELDDKFVQIADQMAQSIPTASRINIPHAGHTVHLESPVTFQDAVLGFLQSQ